MGSLGTGELLVIAIAALVVFGPKRLPELARKAGELLEKARSATRTLTDSLDTDYGELAAPLQTLKSEYDATVQEIKSVGTAVTGLGTTLPGENVVQDNSQQEPADTPAEEANGESVDDAKQESEQDTEQEAEQDTDDRGASS